MVVIDLKKLNLRTRESLEKAGIASCEAIIQMSETEFRKLGNLSQNDYKDVTVIAAENLLPQQFITAATAGDSCLRKWNQLSVGCKKLDWLLRGGIPLRGITELAGESGTGKTQFCLQLCLTVQYPRTVGGLGSGAVYVCTEDKFPSNRLYQLFKTFSSTLEQYSDYCDLNFGDNIFIEHIADVESLKQCVLVLLPQLLNKRSIGLVVVDSIAAVFRAEYSFKDGFARAKDLRTVGMQLHALANQYQIAVVCINQVTDVISEAKEQKQSVPALGLAWANLVTTRLQMIKNGDRRSLQVVFAPELRQISCCYQITTCGISGIE